MAMGECDKPSLMLQGRTYEMPQPTFCELPSRFLHWCIERLYIEQERVNCKGPLFVLLNQLTPYINSIHTLELNPKKYLRTLNIETLIPEFFV